MTRKTQTRQTQTCPPVVDRRSNRQIITHCRSTVTTVHSAAVRLGSQAHPSFSAAQAPSGPSRRRPLRTPADRCAQRTRRSPTRAGTFTTKLTRGSLMPRRATEERPRTGQKLENRLGCPGLGHCGSNQERHHYEQRNLRRDSQHRLTSGAQTLEPQNTRPAGTGRAETPATTSRGPRALSE